MAWIVISALLLAEVLIMAYAVKPADDFQAWLSIVGAASLVGSASTAIGMLTGALFGIPKAVETDHRPRDDAQGARHFAANTNLEDVSDWLTKIIIGVGLVEFRQLADQLGRLGDNLSAPLGDATGASSVGVAIVLLHAAIGFLGGYLLSRLILPRLFEESDRIIRMSRPTGGSDEPDSG